ANTFYANGITGQGSVTANVEAGFIWNGHETLGHVSQYVNDPSAFDDPGTVGNQTSDLFDRHATWVGMTIGGRNTANPQGYQTGIAPGTDLKSGAISSGWAGNAYALSFSFTANSFVTPYAAYFGSSDVINSSWGGTDTFGADDTTIALDGLAIQNPRTTFVASAGNDGDPDNNPSTPPVTNTVGAPASGYNSISVGALQNDGNNHYNSVASFSSRGPQDFGYADFSQGGATFGCLACRAAVDIVAPGTNLTLAYYGGATGGNNPTLTGSPSGSLGGPNVYSGGLAGTSFAAPIVAGGAALLDSASYNTPALAVNPNSRDARVIKAVLMNSATKIAGWNNGETPNANGGVDTQQSLDYNSGAGAMNLTAAYAQYVTAGTRDVPGTAGGVQVPVAPVGWDFGQVTLGTDNVYPIAPVLNAGMVMTVTLDWFRDRIFDTSTFDLNEVAQSDLDLYVRDTITGNLISASDSFVNDVEHLFFALPRSSRYQIEINFSGTVFDFTGTHNVEQYGLAWSVLPAAVPEPASCVLAAMGFFVVASFRRR
ncbi:MAG TPA: S8 family serine peptidase, partial [Lacipirellulaceae bacterium]|nr:S8 family serine peptidase [Lacipirellulaceae bacterium]